MEKKNLLAVLVLAGTAAACQSSDNISVAEYCADPDRASQNVCQLNVEINGTKTALADTDLRLADARALAVDAMSAATAAQSSADNAQATANEARNLASNALANLDNLKCQTLTINKTDTGTCPTNYRLMSCSQTRYTHRAGGLSFLREINDEKCRFNSRVLEMQVRCCTVGGTPSQVTYRTPTSTPTPSGVSYTPLSSGS